MKKLLILTTTLLLAFSLTGCSTKRSIDPTTSHSTKVEGTSWMRFCDGPNAVIWIPGYQGEDDELEAYIYDHWACAPAYYAKTGQTPQPHAPDTDGVEDDGK